MTLKGKKQIKVMDGCFMNLDLTVINQLDQSVYSDIRSDFMSVAVDSY